MSVTTTLQSRGVSPRDQQWIKRLEEHMCASRQQVQNNGWFCAAYYYPKRECWHLKVIQSMSHQMWMNADLYVPCSIRQACYYTESEMELMWQRMASRVVLLEESWDDG